MKNKERIFWLITVVALFVWNFSSSLPRAKAFSADSEKYMQVFHEVIASIETDYVEAIDEKTLIQGAIKGLLASLNDPHSRFMPEDEFKSLQEEKRGSFGGVGLEVTHSDGSILVISPIEDSPAMKAGMQPQDRILEINGQSTEKMSIMDAVKIMRGQVGTSVTIKIKRKSLREPFNLSLTRELIKIQFLKTTFMDQEKIGYIRLAQFMGSENTLSEFKKMLNDINAKQPKGLIIDLRSNPGGLLDMAVDLCDIFLKPGVDILSVKARGDRLVKIFKATDSGLKVLDVPMVVLLNAGSASASEIFAGAMQDHKRAMIIGTQSFGKGSVQNIYNLSQKTGMALTIQKYYTPSGVSIHKKGITPDILVNQLTPDDDEKIVLEKIAKTNISQTFAKENPDYNDKNVKAFQELIEKKGYILSKPMSRYLIKREYFMNEKQPIIDREFDLQLNKAIEVLLEPKKV